MNNIYDYLRLYKNTSIKEVPFNIMDNLLCAILVYLPIEGFVFEKNINEIYDLVKQVDVKKGVMAPLAKKVLELIKDSERYKNLKFRNFNNYVNEKTQFGALTLKLDNIKVISFKGTDKSTIGWIENFRLSYEYPTYTQELAAKYLRNNISLLDRNVYVTGHSKGGNLAMASSMEMNNFVFSKIKEVINFDGPGFREQEFESKKYERLSAKLTNIIPEGSYIGVLMFNKNYQIVKSDASLINVHYPTSWISNGTLFEEGKYTKFSKDLHQKSSTEALNIDEKLVKEVFEEAFEILIKKKSITGNFSMIDFHNIIKSINKIDNKVSKYISTIINTMTSVSNKKKD